MLSDSDVGPLKSKGSAAPAVEMRNARILTLSASATGELMQLGGLVQLTIEGHGRPTVVAREGAKLLLAKGCERSRRSDMERFLRGWRESAPRETPPPKTAEPLIPTKGPSPYESALNGDLEQFDLGELFEILRLTRRTGTLLCRFGRDSFAFALRSGALTAATAPSALPEHIQHLWRGARIERDQDGIIELLKRASAASGGSFELLAHIGPESEPDTAFDPQMLLLELARRSDEEDTVRRPRERPAR